METIETDDLYRGASLMCLGAELTALHRRGNNVQFSLNANNLIRLDMSYRMGKTLVNPLQLKETINLLRDLIFERSMLTTTNTKNPTPDTKRTTHAYTSSN